MRPDLERLSAEIRPLIGDVEKLAGTSNGANQERDEDIIRMLRQKLKERTLGNVNDTQNGRPVNKGQANVEDKYEPQRINRKICWQYDVNAKKVPLLRRPYI